MSTLRLNRTLPPASIPATWQRPLLWLGVSWAALFALFWRDAADLGGIWWNSSTFSHCLLLMPILGWLVWLRAGELAKLSPHAWARGLLWIAAGAVAWLFGEAASVALLRQLGLIIMLQGTVPALLGPQVARGLIFPLLYSLFLVPAGEELVPPMQTLTADMAMAMLRLAGIPAYIEGIFITTPAGLFAVAEACSGVKFLIAMAALAVLTAHLCFTSWRRRAIFLIVALIVPVLANGFRAFSTMWIAEYWGIEFAAGADHVIYGWVFFGLVIIIVGAIFWHWFDREPDDVPIDGAALQASHSGKSAPAWAISTALAMLAVAPVLWLARGDRVDTRGFPMAERSLPAGWAPTALSTDWVPRFDGADHMECLTVREIARPQNETDICIAHFSRQDEGLELVGYGQGAVDPDSNWRWSEALEPLGPMRVDHIASNTHRIVATLYAVGNIRTASATRVKVATLQARLLRGNEHAAALLVSARAEGGGRASVTRFLDAAGGGDALLARLTTPR
jgi:exosortase A